jgi:hypothetical protein
MYSFSRFFCWAGRLGLDLSNRVTGLGEVTPMYLLGNCFVFTAFAKMTE